MQDLFAEQLKALRAASSRGSWETSKQRSIWRLRGFFPWIVGDEQAALDLAAALKSEGFLVPAIRYPTVAKGSARLRITVTAAQREDQIRALCEAIRKMTKHERRSNPKCLNDEDPSRTSFCHWDFVFLRH